MGAHNYGGGLALW